MSLGDYFLEFVWLIAPALMFAGSIVAWRKRRRWPEILQVIGSAALLGWGAFMFVSMIGGVWGIIDPHFFRTPQGSWLRHFASYCFLTGGVCFPVGFFCDALRANRYI
jgi:hypothetical protein